MKRIAGLLGLMMGLHGCAALEPSKTFPDSIIVPDSAAPVDHIAHSKDQHWTPLNQRMLLVVAARTPYLLTFDTRCPTLTRPHPTFSTWVQGNQQLEARTGTIWVEGVQCLIDHIYSISDEDSEALRTQFER